MINKTIKELMLKEPDYRDRVKILRNHSVSLLQIFQWIFWTMYRSDVAVYVLKKARGKDMLSANTIKKKYNPHLILSLCLLKLFVPYRNMTANPMWRVMLPSGRDLMIVWGVVINYKLFIDAKEFAKMVRRDPSLGKIPEDFQNIIDNKSEGAKGYNFDKYTRSFTKELFISAISFLCKSIDSENFQGDKLDIFKSSIRNLIDDLNVPESAYKKMAFHPVTIGSIKKLTPFDHIYNDKTSGYHSYYKTRERFCTNFPKAVREKMPFGK